MTTLITAAKELPVRAPIPSSLLFYNNNYFYALPLVESSYSLPSLGCGSRARLLGDTNTQRQNLFGVKLAKGMALSRFQEGADTWKPYFGWVLCF